MANPTIHTPIVRQFVSKEFLTHPRLNEVVDGTNAALRGLADLTPEESQPSRIGTFPVRVVQVGGAAGTSTTAATWTYDVYRPTGDPAGAVTSGTKIGAAVNLRNVSDGQRPKGLLLAGDNYGLAFYDGTTLILWDAGEKEDTAVGCTA